MVLKCQGWSRKWRGEQLDPPVIREETAIRHCGPLWNGSIGNWYWQALIKTPFCGKLGKDKIKNERVSRVSGHSKTVEKCFQIYQEDFSPHNLCKMNEKTKKLFPFARPHEYIKVLYHFRYISLNAGVVYTKCTQIQKDQRCWVLRISVFEKENISSQAAKCTYLEPAPFVTLPP